MLCASPPVNTISGSGFIREAIAAIRPAVDSISPWMIASREKPRLRRPITSDSRKRCTLNLLHSFPGVGRRNFAGLLYVQPETVGHNLHETACSGGAFIIHDKLFNPARRSYQYGFGILPAYVDDGADAGAKLLGPAGVTGNFGNVLMDEVQTDSSVPCTYDKREISEACPAGQQGFIKKFAGRGGDIPAGGTGKIICLPAVVQTYFYGGGADVYPRLLV